MTLTYKWKNMKVNVETEVNDNHTDSPHTHEEIRDVEYDFWVEIKLEDVIEYLKPSSYSTAEKVLEYLLEQEAVDFYYLENDEYFVEFMKEKYEEQALEQWEENYNDEY